MGRKRESKRQLCERLWREDVPGAEIVRRMGWSTNSPPSSLFSHYRNNRGWDLPVRDRKRSRSIAAAHARRSSASAA